VPRAKCFVDFNQAIEKTSPQAIIIATPPDHHVQVCEMALARALAVMVEKPFTLRLPEAVRLVSLAERQNVPILVAHNYRYLRSFRAAKQLIDEQRLGQIGMVVSHYYRPPHDMAQSLTRLENSVLWGMSIHHLDALRFILTKPVTNVIAETFSLPAAALPAGASFRALLSFEGGTRATYSATYESSGHQFFERGQEFYARFAGDRATLHVFHRWLILCENGKLPRVVRRGPRRWTEEQVLLQQLQRAIITGEPAEVSGKDNLQTMAVVEACLRSAAEKTWTNPQTLLNELQ
jgi:predicted dehydrogenase